METYTVSLLLENVDLTDEVLDAIFTEFEDVVPSSIDGAVKLTASIEAANDESAAFRLIDQVHSVLPQAAPVRLDQDLVSIPDIAERSGRSRESVRLLVAGKRGPGQFPISVGTVGDGIRVWPWAVVLDWFRDALHEDLGERGVSPEAAALVDACLAGKRRHTFAHRRQIAWTSIRQPGRTKVVATSYEVATVRQSAGALSA
ncbi:MAG TPA: hypothetical protein VIR58_12050 [Acidimicrobiales bacterium]